MRTAALSYAHALRVANFIAVSDGPLTFEPDRWESVLRTAQIDGKPALDLTTASGKKSYDELVDVKLSNSAADPLSVEDRDHLLARIGAGGGVITDDNMRSEWYPTRPRK